VDLGNPSLLQLTGPMTLTAWARPDSVSDNGRIITKGGASGNRGWSLNVENTGNWAFQVAVSSTALTAVEAPGAPLNTWTHVAGVYDPSGVGGPSIRLYTNGLLAKTLTAGVPAAQYNSGVNVSIGARADGTTRWNGRLDEVRVYARALSQPEIAELMDPPVVRPELLPPSRSGNQLILDWTGSGKLEWAPTVYGLWTEVAPSPTPPYAESLVQNENRFYRLKVQ